MRVKDRIKELQMCKPDDEIAFICWCKDDVLKHAKDLEIEITDTEANEVIERLHNKADCEHGMTWDTIEMYLRDMEEERPKREKAALIESNRAAIAHRYNELSEEAKKDAWEYCRDDIGWSEEEFKEQTELPDVFFFKNGRIINDKW